MPKRRKKIIEGVKAIDLGDKGQTIGKTPEGEVVIINGGCCLLYTSPSPRD